MALGSLITKFLSAEQLRAIALWALHLVEENLDTDLKARLETYRQDRAKWDQETLSVLADNAAKEERLRQLTLQGAALEQSIAMRTAKIQQSKEEVRRIDEAPSKVDDLSSSDVFHTDLRR
jgi:hypothetical protein